MTTTTHHGAPRHRIGQIWGTPTVAGFPVTITDVLPAGAVAFMRVTDGHRDRLPADEFARRYPRLLAEPKHAPPPDPDTAPASTEVPDEF